MLKVEPTGFSWMTGCGVGNKRSEGWMTRSRESSLKLMEGHRRLGFCFICVSVEMMFRHLIGDADFKVGYMCLEFRGWF